ncbi:double-strand break repair protein AddB [Pseudovibrio sp. SPO723]|uniref:double-strand break repair protein AddB n=1 Tax=Nesiotobacter zosterae TaxID=392721 RepID=UPI0029C1721E|nr:double-strand break repair protein AddB [Pseudovibrio sp. SPO723]MDX5592120.1 double-strand break repair protein AddB [Pseudovibrio sp. SPO723]
MSQNKLFTIAPPTPFLQTLVENLLTGELVPGFDATSSPLALSKVTIYVPTRRAARSLPTLLREAMGQRSILLPKILPLGDVEEDEQVLRQEPDAEPLPPAMSLMERKLAMTQLVWAWKGHLRRELLGLGEGDTSAFPASSADAAWLAGDLLTLMDEVQTEEANWTDLTGLVPDNHAQYWQITLEFLRIVSEQWPAFLKEAGFMDPKARRSALIRRAAQLLRDQPPKGPVIVAGATGSVPATAELLKAVLSLEHGAIVLPALDQRMDNESWKALGGTDEGMAVPGHPQYSLQKLLATLGRTRDDVVALGTVSSPSLSHRSAIVNEALRPADTTDAWQGFFASELATKRPEAFQNVAVLSAGSEAEEALAVALVLREGIEADKKVALITPDRTLSRRVASELARWNIAVDDTAGRPQDQTPPTILAMLTAKLALGGLDPVQLLALLKHPLARFGLPVKEVRAAARALERGVLRGPSPRPGISGLKEAILAARSAVEDRHTPRWKKLVEADWQSIDQLVMRLEEAIGPLEALLGAASDVDVKHIAQLHTDAVIKVAEEEDGSTTELFKGETGAALADTLTSLLDAETSSLAIPAAEWPGVFAALVSGNAVRSKLPADPRVHLLGPMEARLQHFDRVVLGGLNEGIWPQRTRNDPWLNRPMKGQIGLDPPERRIGSSAHDFLCAMGAEEVVLSRSARVDGAPAVASRWLQRILTLAGDEVTTAMKQRGTPYVEMARTLDRLEVPVMPAERPEPKPPLNARPKQLSVTRIETLIRDPYEIYARNILRLEEVDPIGGEPNAADKGTIIHDALANFLSQWDAAFDDKAIRALLDEGGRLFRPLDAFPAIRALWWPRFEKIAESFVGFEYGRAADIERRFLEVSGGAEMKRPDGSTFKLTGRADRIDLMKGNQLQVIDYKTGVPPSQKQVEALLSPQLPLEVAMIRRGGFEGIPAEAPVSSILYVQLKGGREALKVHNRDPEDQSVEELAEEAWSRLEQLVAAYENPAKGYLSRARVLKERQWASAYDHLARVQEWSLGGEGEDD